MADQTHVKPDSTATSPGAPTSVEHTEPQNSYTSGGQQKDQRHELKKSVQNEQRAPEENQAPGLHRTGSYTGTAGGPGPDER